MPVAVTNGEIVVQAADLPKTIQLDGSGSSAAPGRTIQGYQWTALEIPEGSTAELVGPTTATPTLTLDVPGSYLYVLEVTDSEGDKSDTDVRTMPATAYAVCTVPTARFGLVACAWQQRAVARKLQRNVHAIEAALVDLDSRLNALEET